MKNLRRLRQLSGLSQEKLAQEFEITQQAIYKYETGLSQPDLDRLMEFSDFFDTSVDYLIGHTEDPRPIPSATPDTLDADGYTLLSCYRSLPGNVRSDFLSLMQSYAALMKDRPGAGDGQDEPQQADSGTVTEESPCSER